jgi:L-ascorbate metabolism protein UlaG (beta-lactamase superfamily)
MATLTWHGHSCISLVTDEGTKILFDPFLSENPAADIKPDDIAELDYILVSHGHFDHFMDCIPLAKRTGATVISTFELVNYCSAQGVEKVHGMNIGGAHRFPFGRVKLTPAVHTGGIDGDDAAAYTTHCSGFLLNLTGGQRLYYSGDTALTRDLELLAGSVDVALLPIGDNFTMDPVDAARAVGFVRPRTVIPVHYNTWELIAQDPEEFRRLVGDQAEVVVLKPGESWRF